MKLAGNTVNRSIDQCLCLYLSNNLELFILSIFLKQYLKDFKRTAKLLTKKNCQFYSSHINLVVERNKIQSIFNNSNYDLPEKESSYQK